MGFKIMRQLINLSSFGSEKEISIFFTYDQFELNLFNEFEFY